MRTFLVWAGARRHERPARSFARCVAALLVVASFASCGGAPRPLPAVELPTYTPEEAALFNDLFRPELFGYPGIAPPEADTLLADRVAQATSVVPAKVVTVTLEGDGARRNYSVVVQPVEAALAGRPLSDSVTLRVAHNSPIFGWVEGAARGFVGTRLLLLVRFFHDGPHFHGTVDTAVVREAIRQAKLSIPQPPQSAK